MATLNPLSPTLTLFKASYSSIAGINTDSITNPLTTASTVLESAISGFNAAGNDSVVSKIVEGATLAREGVERVKGHVTSDIANLKSNASDVYGIIQKIEDLIRDGASWQGAETITETLKNGKTEQRIDYHDQAKIDRANAEIDYYNSKGEAQLNAMADAINGVAFGVTGNMALGESLGPSTGYLDGYKFKFNDFSYEASKNEDNQNNGAQGDNLTFLEEAGCLVVGGVSSVAKVGEGVVDFGATLIGGGLSWLGGVLGIEGLKNAGDSMVEFAEHDYVGEATDWVLDQTGISKDAYDNSIGQKIGSTVGTVASHGALWLTGAGAFVSSASLGGQRMEQSLQEGNSTGSAILSGVTTAGLSYAGGHALKALGGRAVSWLSDPARGGATVLGKVYSAATTRFGTGWGAATGTGVKGLANKAISIAASPLRGVSNVMTSGANHINSALSGSRTWHALGTADAAVDGVANRLFGGAAASATAGAGGTPAGGATTSGTPAGGATTSGTPAGGAPTSGTPAGGAPTSGTPAGGAATSGTPAGGAATSGTPAGGATTSGAPAGGTPSGASTGAATGGSPSGLSLSDGATIGSNGALYDPANLSGAPTAANSVFNDSSYMANKVTTGSDGGMHPKGGMSKYYQDRFGVNP